MDKLSFKKNCAASVASAYILVQDPAAHLCCPTNRNCEFIIHQSLLRSSVINGLKVKLTDERDRLLSLNGLHFQVGLLFRFVSLKRQDPLLDLRRMLLQQQQQQQQQQPKKNKRQQRKRALKRGKQKIQTAQARALQAQQQQQRKQTKTSETPSPEKSSDK